MRLLDLYCNWARQYACETTQDAPVLHAQMPRRWSQVDGYLTTTGAAVLPCERSEADWAAQDDPWQTLGAMIARYEAEFSGRLLQGPEDLARWEAEPDDFLCWGLLGVAGLGTLVRGPRDMDRLARLFDRGVRVFQLGGGIPDLGPRMLDLLADLGPNEGQLGPRAVVDLAGMTATGSAGVLDWLEADSSRQDRVGLVRSHGPIPVAAGGSGSEFTLDVLTRFRALGGLLGLSVGPPFVASADELRSGIEAVAAVPYQGRAGCEGIAVGTAFLDLEEARSPLENASAVVEWLGKSFSPPVAESLIRGNALALFRIAAGAGDASISPPTA